MATEEERLVVLMEARLRDFERALDKANGLVDRRARQMERRFDRMNKRIATGFRGLSGVLGGALGGLGVGFLGGLGAGSLVSTLRSVADEVGRIGDVAQKVGLTTDQLQELRYAGEQTGVATNQLDVAMQRFSRRVAEAASGTGVLKDVLAANGIELRNADGSLRSQIDILGDYADLIKNARNEQDQLRLAFLAFDSEGAALVNTLRNGADGLRQWRDEAHDVGAVIDRDIIDKADEVDRAFNRIASTIGTTLKSAIIEAVSVLGEFLDMLNTLDTRAEATIRNQIEKNRQAMIDAQRSILGEFSGTFVANMEAENRRLATELARRALAAGNTPVPTRDEFLGRADERTAGGTVIPPSGGGGGGRGGGGRGGTRTNELEREIEQITRRTEALRREAEIIGLTEVEAEKLRVEHELLAAAEAAGVPVTDQLRAKIGELATGYAQASETLQRLVEEQEALKDAQQFLAETAASAFSALITGASSAEEAVQRLIRALADAVLQAALLGQGPLAGLFGLGGTNGGVGGLFGALFGLFGGGRAAGGSVQAGKMYPVGEQGTELFVPGRSGTIIPNHAIARAAGAAGEASIGLTINPSPEFDVRIDRVASARAAVAVDVAQRSVRKRLPSMIAEAQARSL